jgi:hypothetical protein
MGGRRYQQRRAQRGKFENRAEGRAVTIPRPPTFDPTLTHQGRFRYLVNTSVAQPISYQNLMDTQVIAISAVAGVQMYDCVRVKRVEIWAASSGGAVTCSIQFLGKSTGFQGDQKAYTDTALAVGEPLHVVAKPSKWAQAAQFQTSSTATAFYITCPSGACVDLVLEFRNNYDASPTVGLTNGIVGASAGDMYYRGFDGLAIASTKFVPQGVIGIA